MCYALLMRHPPCFANGCLRWDHHHKVEFCSEKVEIVFSAFYSTVNQIGEMASAVQKRDITKHLNETVSFLCDLLIVRCIISSSKLISTMLKLRLPTYKINKKNGILKSYIHVQWLHYLRSAATEAEWQRNRYVPTVEEYMIEAVNSFAEGPIMLTSLYFVQQKLEEYIIKDPEYDELIRLKGNCGRLLNDTRGFEVFFAPFLTKYS